MSVNKELFSLLEKDQAFQNPLKEGASKTSSNAAEGVQNINGLLGADEQTQEAMASAGLTPARLTLLSGSLGTASTSSQKISDYGDQTIDEMYKRSGTAVSNKQADLFVGNPQESCDITNKFFGVIQESGARWLGELDSAIGNINKQIENLLDAIEAGFGKIQEMARALNQYIDEFVSFVAQKAQEILDGIQEELDFILDKIKRSIQLGFASIFDDWLNDPCLKQVFQQTGSPELQTIIQEKV